jgi:hypothetical protein
MSLGAAWLIVLVYASAIPASSCPFLNALVSGGEPNISQPQGAQIAVCCFLTVQTTSPCNLMWSVSIT